MRVQAEPGAQGQSEQQNPGWGAWALLGNQSWTACLHKGQLNTPQPPQDHKISSSSSTGGLRIWEKDLGEQEKLIQRLMGACSSTSLYSGAGRVKCLSQCVLCQLSTACLAKCVLFKGAAPSPHLWLLLLHQYLFLGNGWLPLWKINHFQQQTPPGRAAVDRGKMTFCPWDSLSTSPPVVLTEKNPYIPLQRFSQGHRSPHTPIHTPAIPAMVQGRAARGN